MSIPSTPARASENSASVTHRALAKVSETPALPRQATELSSSTRSRRCWAWAMAIQRLRLSASVTVA